MDMSEYKEAFKAESEENLQQMNDSLLGLEQDPEDMEHINIMFRSAHTLKGMSATMGFSAIAELTHEMENLMDGIREGKTRLEESIIDVLFECLDTLETLVGSIESDLDVDITHLQVRLKLFTELGVVVEQSAEVLEPTVPATELGKAVENSMPENDIEFSNKEIEDIEAAKQEGSNVLEAKVSLDESCVFKAARSILVMGSISDIGNIIKTIPPVSDLEDGKFDLDFTVVFSTESDIDTIKDSIKNVSEVKDTVISTLSQNKNDALFTPAKEKEEANPKEAGESAVKRTETVKSVQSVRVSIERLDNLMDLVGELVINKIRINQLASELKSKSLDEAIATLDRLTNEIQNEVMESRMVPIDQIFSRFPRMVRDLAKSQGKAINLVIEGKEIELDRTVLDEIGDPLVHLLRNAVDHGIEDTDERSQLGKPEAGCVRLAATRQRNSVIIEVEDDGKGMDPAKLRQIAVKKGIMAQDEVDKLSDADAMNLIFAPGFSGAAKVTDVSGRGVGMDAVKNKVESLGGSVTIESTPGKGSKMQLRLPLTIAIIQSLMVKVVDEVYAIPLTNVVRDVGIKSSDIKTIQGKEVIMLRGEVLPLMRLHEVLRSPIPAEEKESLVVVVVEKMGNNIGFVVEKLLGQQEVIIKTLDSKLLKNTKGFAGATILGDGSVSLILDVATLV